MSQSQRTTTTGCLERGPTDGSSRGQSGGRDAATRHLAPVLAPVIVLAGCGHPGEDRRSSVLQALQQTSRVVPPGAADVSTRSSSSVWTPPCPAFPAAHQCRPGVRQLHGLIPVSRRHRPRGRSAPTAGMAPARCGDHPRAGSGGSLVAQHVERPGCGRIRLPGTVGIRPLVRRLGLAATRSAGRGLSLTGARPCRPLGTRVQILWAERNIPGTLTP